MTTRVHSQEPPKRSKRMYTLWGVALLLLTLLGLTVLFFGPPQVWYNAYLLKARYAGKMVEGEPALNAVSVCAEAACRGNRLALNAVMAPRPTFFMSASYAKISMACPEEFVAHLEGKTEEWLVEGLFYAATGLQYEDREVAGRIIGQPGHLEPALALDRLRASKKPEVVRAAEAILAFIERRYPGALKEAREWEAETYR